MKTKIVLFLFLYAFQVLNFFKKNLFVQANAFETMPKTHVGDTSVTNVSLTVN